MANSDAMDRDKYELTQYLRGKSFKTDMLGAIPGSGYLSDDAIGEIVELVQHRETSAKRAIAYAVLSIVEGHKAAKITPFNALRDIGNICLKIIAGKKEV